MLYAYGITPLLEDHFEERALDIIDQIKRHVISMPLFCMTLVPEGTPVWDKAGKMAKLYARYRDRLEPEGVKCGILIQASLGHGYTIHDNPFTKYTGFVTGTEQYVCCPEDEAFIEHFCGVIRTLAKERPHAIMLDDDFRLLNRPGLGCACKLHMAEFNRRTGLNMTREELLEHIDTHSNDDPLADVFRDIQGDSLIKAAKAFRQAIDSVDPSIQGINCASATVCEAVMFTNPIFAGKGNPTMVRIPNGIYAPYGIRGFSGLMQQTAICRSKLKKYGIEHILSETDTIPFNRYAKGARYLHAHYTASLLDGLVGAKHWITRLNTYEFSSGKAYRDILAENHGFYEAISAFASKIKWCGIGHIFAEEMKFCISRKANSSFCEASFITGNLERMGIPFFYTENKSKAVFLEGNTVSVLSDEKLYELFEGSVFCDARAAELLIERGFGKYLGVNIEPWGNHGLIEYECFDNEVTRCCTPQMSLRYLSPADSKTCAVSYNMHFNDSKPKLLAPSVTVLPREDRKISVVFCGSPAAPFTYGEGFSFLNELRKDQLISLLSEADALPVYCHGDDEICLRAGYIEDEHNEKTLLAALFEIGIDPADSITLGLAKRPGSIEMLCSDGSLKTLNWHNAGDGLYKVDVRLETLNPVILFIK